MLTARVLESLHGMQRQTTARAARAWKSLHACVMPSGEPRSTWSACWLRGGAARAVRGRVSARELAGAGHCAAAFQTPSAACVPHAWLGPQLRAS